MSLVARAMVLNAIQAERDYQNKIHGGPVHDRTHTVAEWLEMMNDKLRDAQEYVFHGENNFALEEMLKIVALGVACMEVHGVRKRR